MSRTSTDPATRDALVGRWTRLTREVLPGMAAAFHWPIRLDHCFMRVCLDAALGARWDTVVRRPAIRHLSDAQLARATAQAEAIAARPDLLPRLNQESLRLRGRGRSSPQASPTLRREAGPPRVLRSPRPDHGVVPGDAGRLNTAALAPVPAMDRSAPSPPGPRPPSPPRGQSPAGSGT